MTGFAGRMGLYELLVITEAFKEKVSREPNIDALKRQAIATACAHCVWPVRCAWPKGTPSLTRCWARRRP